MPDDGKPFNVYQLRTEISALRRRVGKEARFLAQYFTKEEALAILEGQYRTDPLSRLVLPTAERVLKKGEKKGDDGSEERKWLRALFSELYGKKAQEIAGRDASPRFDARENALLLKDWEKNGRELGELIALFFSDKVETVASFCRHKEKAGYGYRVFHGMLPKLEIEIGKYPRCKHCGRIGSHRADCKLLVERAEREQAERDEIQKAKETAAEGLDLKAMFRDKLRGNGSSHNTGGIPGQAEKPQSQAEPDLPAAP